MNPDLVMAKKDGRIYRTHPAQAKADGAEVLEESPYTLDGQPKPARRANGRPSKPKTTVDKAAATKKKADTAETAEEGQA